MITNTKNLGSVPTPDNIAPRTPAARPGSGQSPVPAQADTLSTDNAANLKAALALTPALRPEVIERAAALATDPGYPSDRIVGKMARAIAQSEDPSGQEE